MNADAQSTLSINAALKPLDLNDKLSAYKYLCTFIWYFTQTDRQIFIIIFGVDNWNIFACVISSNQVRILMFPVLKHSKYSKWLEFM